MTSMLLEGIWGKTIQCPVYIWHMNQPSYCELCFFPLTSDWMSDYILPLGIRIHPLWSCCIHTELSKSLTSSSKCQALSCVWLTATPWTVAHQGPLSIGFSRQEYWSGLPFPPPGESSQPRDRTWLSCIEDRFFTMWPTREAHNETIPGFSISRNCDEVILIVLIIYQFTEYQRPRYPRVLRSGVQHKYWASRDSKKSDGLIHEDNSINIAFKQYM